MPGAGSRRVFRAIAVQAAAWDEAQAACKDILASLEAAGEAAAAVEGPGAAQALGALAPFAGLQRRLGFAHVVEAESLLRRLRVRMLELERVVEALGVARRGCWAQLASAHGAGGLDAVVDRTPARPSFADFVEWAEDVERIYAARLAAQKSLVAQLRAARPDAATRALAAWDSSVSSLQARHVREVLRKVLSCRDE